MLPQHVDVNVPERLQARLGHLLKDFEAFAQRRGFVTKRVEKESGGHVTPFWVYVRLDERAPSRSLLKLRCCAPLSTRIFPGKYCASSGLPSPCWPSPSGISTPALFAKCQVLLVCEEAPS